MKNCFIVENEEGKRIDRYLAEQMPDMSRSYIQKIIKDGLVTVSEKPVKANYRLSLYESIKVTIPELKEPEIEAENIPLDILYEDQDIIVINKFHIRCLLMHFRHNYIIYKHNYARNIYMRMIKSCRIKNTNYKKGTRE